MVKKIWFVYFLFESHMARKAMWPFLAKEMSYNIINISKIENKPIKISYNVPPY